MSTQGSTALEKAEVHTESIQQVQPIDLASGRNAGGQVVQLRPVRAFSTAHVTGKSVVGGGPSGVGGLTAVNAPIISVNRPGNLTLLPTVTLPSRAGSAIAAGQPVSGSAQVTQAISTYQIARVGNMRSATLATGQQPASITVTPISASNFSANIRLTGATVNNGSWIQTNSGAQGAFATPLRAATITVGGRPVRQDTAKMIHIPQQGSVQHVAQLQMVDGKGSLLKPGLTTPLMNIRGALQGGGGPGQPVTLPIAPFTIRTANITNLSPMQQRPQTSTSAANQVQKVITQPPHGTPIQFVNAGNKNVIQAITTPLPRLNVNAVNAVCLTLSTNAATLAPNSSSPAVAVASKQGATSLIMTPSLGAGGLPQMTKMIPVGRDGSASIVDSLFAQPNSSTSNAVTVSAVSASGTQVCNNTSGHGHNITSGNMVLTASPSITTHGASSNSSVSISQSHHLLHVQGPINVHPGNAAVGLQQTGIASPGSLTSGYFVEKNGNLSLLPSAQSRPITLEKRMPDGKSIPTGSMILTTQHPHIQSGGGHAVTIPIAGSHGTQHVSFAHPLSMSHSMGQHQLPSSAQIITTPISAQAHHIASTVLSTMSSTPTISVSASSQQMSFLPGGGGLPHSIPTHVISQPQSGPLSIGSCASNPLGHISVSTSSMSMACSNVSVTNSGNMPSNSAISVSINPISSVPTNTSLSTTSLTSMSTTTTTSSTMNSNSLSTAAPAQSPNKSTTHSPRPSILRKQREFGDNHHIPPRSQRNLTLQLNYTGNNNSNSSSSTSSNITSASSATATSTANKENAGAMERGPPPPGGNNNGTTSLCGNLGVSILRKEFQPPNEESSWQSCSSHSSGSTTISATSETAEFQINQEPSSNTVGGGGGMDITVNNVPLNCVSGSGSIVVPSSTSSFGGNTTRETVAGSSSSAISQNGLGRSISSSGSHGRGVHRSSSSKLQNRDLERIRREKEDSVSPRKKPRKQQLTTSDFIEAASPEISFYQGRGKKFRRMENNIFDGYSQSNKPGVDPSSMEDSTPPKVVCVIKRPRMSMLSKLPPAGKTRLNHFEHYSEVKAKEERRPAIADLANQKNIMQKVSGWKIQHMTDQMEQVVDLEVSVVNSFNSLLTRLESKVGPNCADRDINRILELLKGNIQRCKVIRDQMSESRSQALRILEHKPRIVDVITKHMTKKPQKKKDRL